MARPSDFSSFGFALVVAASAPAASPPSLPTDPWAAYKARFVTAEGRVIDTGNGGISHSEGQGYAMLLAVDAGDKATFGRLWDWTAYQLRSGGDRLFAWKWTVAQGIADPNNATDGDVLIAWALLRASKRFDRPTYRREALAIAAEVLARLLRRKGELTYLLPGVAGFEHAEGDVINPSYLIFPAFDELGDASGRKEWRQLAASGVTICKHARFGRYDLPPDWLQLGPVPRPAPGFPARFGFDAVRVPLYLIWGARSPELLAPFKLLWYSFPAGSRPAWLALTGEGASAGPRSSPAPEPERASFALSPGMEAVAQAALAYPRLPPAPPPGPDARCDYYDASLRMLARLVRAERGGK